MLSHNHPAAGGYGDSQRCRNCPLNTGDLSGVAIILRDKLRFFRRLGG